MVVVYLSEQTIKLIVEGSGKSYSGGYSGQGNTKEEKDFFTSSERTLLKISGYAGATAYAFSKASPIFSADLEIMKKSFFLGIKPMADTMGMIIRPMAIGVLRFMTWYYKNMAHPPTSIVSQVQLDKDSQKAMTDLDARLKLLMDKQPQIPNLDFNNLINNTAEQSVITETKKFEPLLSNFKDYSTKNVSNQKTMGFDLSKFVPLLNLLPQGIGTNITELQSSGTIKKVMDQFSKEWQDAKIPEQKLILLKSISSMFDTPMSDSDKKLLYGKLKDTLGKDFTTFFDTTSKPTASSPLLFDKITSGITKNLGLNETTNIPKDWLTSYFSGDTPVTTAMADYFKTAGTKVDNKTAGVPALVKTSLSDAIDSLFGQINTSILNIKVPGSKSSGSSSSSSGYVAINGPIQSTPGNTTSPSTGSSSSSSGYVAINGPIQSTPGNTTSPSTGSSNSTIGAAIGIWKSIGLINDGIVTKDGKVIKTDPQDNIYASKGAMGGSTIQTMNVNISVQNAGDKDLREIATKVNEYIQRGLTYRTSGGY